jgi:hypothetical protein
LGASLNLPMGNNSIFVEVHYAFGLRNIKIDPKDAAFKSRGISLFYVQLIKQT